MKELTIEEKAKRYDEALEKARQLCAYPTTKPFISDLQDLFPELAESEDETIRKFIKDVLDSYGRSIKCPTKDILLYEKSVAWLKKQDEQKPVVPKFRVGDKVKKGYLTYTVEDIGEDSYKLQAYSKDGDKGCTEFLTIGYEKDYELVESKPIEWSKEDEEMLEKVIDNIECPPCTTANYKPIREMVDWLKFLKDRVQPQPKQEWSEKDEDKLNRIYEILPKCICCHPIECKELQDFLKSLSPQNRWKPTEEQLKAIMYAREMIPETRVGNYNEGVLAELYKQLKAHYNYE